MVCVELMVIMVRLMFSNFMVKLLVMVESFSLVVFSRYVFIRLMIFLLLWLIIFVYSSMLMIVVRYGMVDRNFIVMVVKLCFLRISGN